MRVLDVNDDGFMDVVIGNPFAHETRVWSSEKQAWERTSFPGADLFREHCVSCHRFRGEGAEVAPALDDFTTKPVALFVESVLDPNRALDPDFVQYAVVTRDGRALGGLLRNETQNSVTVLASATE